MQTQNGINTQREANRGFLFIRTSCASRKDMNHYMGSIVKELTWYFFWFVFLVSYNTIKDFSLLFSSSNLSLWRSCTPQTIGWSTNSWDYLICYFKLQSESNCSFKTGLYYLWIRDNSERFSMFCDPIKKRKTACTTTESLRPVSS